MEEEEKTKRTVIYLTEDNIREIAKAYKDGDNVATIAERLGVTAGQVASCLRKLRKLGVTLPSRSNDYLRVVKDLKAEETKMV